MTKNARLFASALAHRPFGRQVRCFRRAMSRRNMRGIYGKIDFNDTLDVPRSCEALTRLRHRGPVYRYLNYEKTIQRYPAIINGYRGGQANNLWKLVVLSHYLELKKKDYLDYSEPANEEAETMAAG